MKTSSELTWHILKRAIDKIQPGMRESEVASLIRSLFEDYKIDRLWHPPYVRFGKHTLLQFHQGAQEDLILQQEDIAFIDIGIVKDGVEGDAGHTLTFGDNPDHSAIQKAAEEIFQEGREYWQQHNPTGIELYGHIIKLTEAKGYHFNLEPAGHLIGAYPHRGWRKGINTFPETISPGHWILEIQICHPTLPFGSFYESLLV